VSPTLVACTPSVFESAALARGLEHSRVCRTGMGPRAAARCAASPRVRAAEALAVVGIAAGVDPRLAPGDVVVASEVRDPEGRRTPCRSAPMLSAALRRAGLRVSEGPVASVTHVITQRERDVLGADGVLCADMESAWLVANPPTPATAVVRVVADPAGHPLFAPATLPRIWEALHTLPRLGDALEGWAAVTGPHRVQLAGPRSFCAGVVRAIEVVERALAQTPPPVYVRRQIVHNSHVVRRLEGLGAVFVDELDQVPAGGTVVFSAHGVSPAVHREARERGLRVIDATCPLVTKVHAELRRFADRGDTVIFIGHRGHDETVGTMGERPDGTVLVQDATDARTVSVDDPDHVSYLVQTTLAADEVGEIVDTLRQRFPMLQAPPSDDICYATTNRQRALQRVAVEADLVLVVGSPNSSNSQRLVEGAARLGRPAHLVDDASDIDLDWLRGVTTIGLTAGASAPESLVDEVVEALQGLGPVELVDQPMVSENVHFVVPKEVRSP
jgi:4-hydroxy-3-methylbut-2-en-1-yl diphosphate reductase